MHYCYAVGGPVGIEPSISISLHSLSTLSQLPTQPPCCYFESVELKWGNGMESNCVGLVGSQIGPYNHINGQTV